MAETSGKGEEIKQKKSSVPLMQKVNKILIPILIILESCDLLIIDSRKRVLDITFASMTDCALQTFKT